MNGNTLEENVSLHHRYGDGCQYKNKRIVITQTKTMTATVPEFDSVATLILVVSIISIIVISKFWSFNLGTN